jgi:hypothetical protein
VTTGQNPPEWPVYRDAAAKKAKPKKRKAPSSHVHGAEVMPGLSERAQKQLKAVPQSISLEPAGSGVKRLAKAEAGI